MRTINTKKTKNKINNTDYLHSILELMIKPTFINDLASKRTGTGELKNKKALAWKTKNAGKVSERRVPSHHEDKKGL